VHGTAVGVGCGGVVDFVDEAQQIKATGAAGCLNRSEIDAVFKACARRVVGLLVGRGSVDEDIYLRTSGRPVRD